MVYPDRIEEAVERGVQVLLGTFVQQLVDDAPDGPRDLVALWVLEPRQSGVET